MKRFKLAAVAAATLMAAGFANAGTLQVVPTSFAAETIPAGGAAAPGFSYAFNAPLDYTSSVKFTMEFKLDGAVWAAAPPAASMELRDPGSTFAVVSSSVALNAAGDTIIATFDSLAGGLASNPGPGSKVFPAFSLVRITANPAILLPSGATFDVCTPAATTVKISTVMKNSLGTETNETNGTLGSLAAQSGPYLSVNKGVIVTMDSVTGAETSKIDVVTPGIAGKAFTNPTDATSATTDPLTGTAVVQIGRLAFTNNAAGALADAGSGFPYTVATAFTTAGNATAAAGNVTVTGATVKINGAFSTGAGTLVSLNTSPACNTAGLLAGTALVPTATAVTIPVSAANLAAMATAFPAAPAAFVCYTVAPVAGNVIPASLFSLDPTSVITRAASESQTNVGMCAKPMYNLGLSGVRIDVRNFVTKGSPAYVAGWRSFLRVINSDEVVTASVRAQVIQNGGALLADAPLVTLAPRAYQQFSSDDFTNAEAINSRIRLSSASSSLRVQSYLFNAANGTFLEMSGAQGGEFVPGAIGTAGYTAEQLTNR